MSDEVNQILRDEYGWPVGVSPAPNATAVALQTRDAEAAARTVDDFCHTYQEPPYGYPGSAYEWARFALFCENVEYWELNTQIAFGQTTEPPLDKTEEAKTVSEWWNAQDHRRSRLGFLLWDADDADSVAWHEHLFACALTVPPEWTTGTDPVIYQLACREGYIQPGVAGFGAAYASQTPRYADVVGLTAQQWLDNLRAADRGMPRPWNPTKPANQVPK